MPSNHCTIIIIHARVPAPSKHCADCNCCDSCHRLRAGTPSVTCGDSSLQLREPRICAKPKFIIKAE